MFLLIFFPRHHAAPSFVPSRGGLAQEIGFQTMPYLMEMRSDDDHKRKPLPTIPPWEIAVMFISEAKVDTNTTARAVVLCRTFEIPFSDFLSANCKSTVSNKWCPKLHQNRRIRYSMYIQYVFVLGFKLARHHLISD